MTSKTWATSAFQRAERFVVSQFLLIRAGLALCARQALRQASGGTILLALYVAASWLYVIGLVGSVVLSVGWLVGWLYVRLRALVLKRKLPVQPASAERNETWPQDAWTVYAGTPKVRPAHDRSVHGLGVDEKDSNRQKEVAAKPCFSTDSIDRLIEALSRENVTMRQKQVLVDTLSLIALTSGIQGCTTNSTDSVAMTDDCSGLHHLVFGLPLRTSGIDARRRRISGHCFTGDALVETRAEYGVNKRSLNLETFQGAEEATVDLYGAVCNAYVQKRARDIVEVEAQERRDEELMQPCTAKSIEDRLVTNVL